MSKGQDQMLVRENLSQTPVSSVSTAHPDWRKGAVDSSLRLHAVPQESRSCAFGPVGISALFSDHTRKVAHVTLTFSSRIFTEMHLANIGLAALNIRVLSIISLPFTSTSKLDRCGFRR